jgi:hypothetical protein
MQKQLIKLEIKQKRLRLLNVDKSSIMYSDQESLYECNDSMLGSNKVQDNETLNNPPPIQIISRSNKSLSKPIYKSAMKLRHIERRTDSYDQLKKHISDSKPSHINSSIKKG